MKVKELLKALEGVDPEAEVIGGAWNGRVDTYKVMDDTWYTEFDNLWSDFYGTPGEMDDRLFQIESENVFYIGSHFTILNRKASADKHFIWRLCEVAESEGTDEERGLELLRMLNKFIEEEYE